MRIKFWMAVAAAWMLGAMLAAVTVVFGAVVASGRHERSVHFRE